MPCCRDYHLLPTSLDAELTALVRACTAAEPAERPSFAEVLQRLAAFQTAGLPAAWELSSADADVVSPLHRAVASPSGARPSGTPPPSQRRAVASPAGGNQPALPPLSFRRPVGSPPAGGQTPSRPSSLKREDSKRIRALPDVVPRALPLSRSAAVSEGVEGAARAPRG